MDARGFVPTDAERWRFLADHALTVHTDGEDYGYMVHWCRTSGLGEPPKFYPVSNGKTAEEAIDRRYGAVQSKARSQSFSERRVWSGDASVSRMG
jgi:hypothetical protein